MNRLFQKVKFTRGISSALCVAFVFLAANVGAADFAAWQFRQEFQITNAGLVKFSLPLDALDSARADLGDLRVADAAGNEVAFSIERPRPETKTIREPKSFHVSLNANSTVLLVETDPTALLNGVEIITPANSFLKPVLIEGSNDEKKWEVLDRGQPIFRQTSGVAHLSLHVRPGHWRFVRLTIDDARSQPIPVTGVTLVHSASVMPAPTESVPVQIVERIESAGQTRLTLNPGAANLDLSALQIQSPDLLFMRHVTLAVREVEENIVREKVLGQGTIYRVAVEGQAAAAQLELPLDIRTPARELLLLIQNDDSPPLQVAAVRAERRPVFLVFYAREPGMFWLWTGNKNVSVPRYDLAALNANFKSLPVSAMQITAKSQNPAYRLTEPLAEIPVTGAALDVAAWRFRKPVQLTRSGVQQAELDVEILAHAQPGFSDLRLVSAGRQIPFLIEHTSLSRAIAVQTTPADDSKTPKLSRWSLKLPQRGLPLTRLTCVASTALFQRSVFLFEEVADDRGGKVRRALGDGAWVQTPERHSKQFSVELSGTPTSDTIYLEINNEDNPPIALGNFQFFYPATRVLFKAEADKPVFIYYGNRRAEFPRYDLNLVAGKIFGAEKATAMLSAEEQLKKISESNESFLQGRAGTVFWAVLILVVAGLLLVISRLLPKAPSTTEAGTASKADSKPH